MFFQEYLPLSFIMSYYNYLELMEIGTGVTIPYPNLSVRELIILIIFIILIIAIYSSKYNYLELT